MPAYDYLCAACEHHFEVRQKMSDPEIGLCPSCGGAVQRLIGGGAGVISKAGGHSGSFPASACGSGAPCCGQSAGCANRDFCEN